MAVRKLQHREGGVYFCTFTCWGWLPLIQRADAYEAVYRWMWIAHRKGCRLVGHVIMPNHVHLLVRVPRGTSINVLLANAKRFMAYELVARLERMGDRATLDALRADVRASDHARGQRHRVFRTSSDIRECTDEEMLTQKLDYIHANPVSGKWSLVEDAMDYPHSSFGFYERGDRSPAPIEHYELMIDGEG